jgi:hypothetical protein
MSVSLISRRRLIVLAAAWAASPVRAADVTAIQARQARAVVQAQLDAFADDDGPRAFDLANAMVRQRFGSPERFMAMIRRSYPVLHRPSSVAFLKPEWEEDGMLLQPVQLSDVQGRGWLASFHLESQTQGKGKAKGNWLIAGCEVVPSEGSFT